MPDKTQAPFRHDLNDRTLAPIVATSALCAISDVKHAPNKEDVKSQRFKRLKRSGHAETSKTYVHG
jgi:hypothetical protein